MRLVANPLSTTKRVGGPLTKEGGKGGGKGKTTCLRRGEKGGDDLLLSPLAQFLKWEKNLETRAGSFQADYAQGRGNSKGGDGLQETPAVMDVNKIEDRKIPVKQEKKNAYHGN